MESWKKLEPLLRNQIKSRTPDKSKISWGEKKEKKNMNLFPCTEQTQSAPQGKDFS